MLNHKNFCGIVIALVWLMAACQPDDSLPYEYKETFASHITSLPTDVRVYDTLSLEIQQPVVSAQWHSTQGASRLITGEGEHSLLNSETINLPLQPTRYQYVPTQAGEHQGWVAVRNELGQVDTMRYRLEARREVPAFNARVFGGVLYVRQDTEPTPLYSYYRLVAQGSDDIEVVLQVQGVDGEYRLGDVIEIPYTLFEQHAFKLPYQINIDSDQPAEQITFVFEDEQQRKLSFPETYLLMEDQPPVYLPPYNARMLNADSVGVPDADFLLYLKQQGDEIAPAARYTVKLLPSSSGIEATYTIGNSTDSYQVNDIFDCFLSGSDRK